VASATFFEQQHLARRNTRVMVILFLLATVAVIVAVDLVAATAYVWSGAAQLPRGMQLTMPQRYALVPHTMHVWVAIATAALIFAVSMFNVARLGGGGAAVAEMVGARRVDPATRDALERRLVNIVEEMAIASGVRVPAVYVMEAEQGINAFAAGWDTSNSIVAVTRGTLEHLSRDELQGVIGHEFSHIVNGDMRLNIRMIGVLAGILFIGSIGQFLMRSTRSSDSKNTSQLFIIGLALFIIGYVGLFFARLIKAAVSRQREFLADASSVQFTRNPDGIAGALDQIRACAAGCAIRSRYAEEISHMFFGQAITVWLAGLFATHPPLEERIKRVNPRFAAAAYRSQRVAAPPAAEMDEQTGAVALAAPAGRRAGDSGVAWGRSAGDSARLVGQLDAAKVDYAARLLATLPVALREMLREGDGARAALIALLLAPKEDVMREQLEAMKAAGLATLADKAAAAAAFTRDLGPAFHLTVVDLALPAIKLATDQARNDLVVGLKAVINADRRVSLHEFVVLMLVRHQLAPPEKPSGGRKLAELAAEAGVVLSLIAHAGIRADATGVRSDALAAAMKAGTQELGLPDQVAAKALTLDSAAAALAALKRLAPLEKARLVKGLFAAVSADGTIRIIEAELMRLVGAVLDCPLPPLLDNIDPATLAA
jgi:Zn-dependent protease with chaperone function